MPVITGFLDDITGTPLFAFSPRIKFQPSGPSVTGPTLWTTKPVYVTPAANGSFTVNLIATDVMQPAVWYVVSVEWLDPAGNYISADYLTWKLYLPSAGGNIGDLLVTPWNPTLAWYGPTGSEYPTGMPVASTLTLNTTTGALYQWSN